MRQKERETDEEGKERETENQREKEGREREKRRKAESGRERNRGAREGDRGEGWQFLSTPRAIERTEEAVERWGEPQTVGGFLVQLCSRHLPVCPLDLSLP